MKKKHNMKIKHFPEIKEEYVAYHKILWQAIIDEIKENGFPPNVPYKTTYLKHDTFKKMFDFEREVDAACFGCEYKNGKGQCFFDINVDVSCTTDDCLNGVYRIFAIAVDDKQNKKAAIKYARKIKNFPIRKKKD